MRLVRGKLPGARNALRFGGPGLRFSHSLKGLRWNQVDLVSGSFSYLEADCSADLQPRTTVPTFRQKRGTRGRAVGGRGVSLHLSRAG